LIEFKKIIRKIKLNLPEGLKKIGTAEYDVEMRMHPLIKWHWAALSKARGEYRPYKVSEDILKQLMTPRVHFFKDYENLTPEDPDYKRLKRNEAVIFPNLFSWNNNVVCRITEKESVSINEFTQNQFFDAFMLSQTFFTHMTEREKIFFPTINMNYLRPSGASILHPHLQIITIPDVPPPILAQIFHFGELYTNQYGSNFFQGYIEAERDAKIRWLGTTGNDPNEIAWMMPFCPLAGRDEVMFIVKNATSFPLNEETCSNLAIGLVKVLKGYYTIGVRSFNMVILSDQWKSQKRSSHFKVFGLIWSRPLENLDSSDFGFAEIGYKIANIQNPPETIAEILKKEWDV